MFIDEATIEEIRQRVDIVETVSSFVELKQSGRSFKGLCPFHLEKTPSFFVNRERQNFHCFGCGVSGNVFTFLMKMEGSTFVDTVQKLAQKVGITVHKQEAIDPKAKIKEELYHLNEIISTWYVKNLLHSQNGKVSREYLEKRGLTDETIRNFSLGYAPPSWDALSLYLIKNGFSQERLLEAGVSLVSSKQKKLYDRFRNRVIFPILNASGRVMGFSGRTLDPKENAKYLNSPESLIFKKNQLLYGIFQAKEEMVKKDSVILVEGHLDLCMMHQYGFKNVVGVQGTAFSDEQARLICRYTKNAVVSFDGDEAGIKASFRFLPIALSHEMNCKIAPLPMGQDPASLLLSKGKKAMESVMKESISLFEYKIKYLIGNQVLTPELNLSVVREMIQDIRSVKNLILLDGFVHSLSVYLRVGEESIRMEINKSSARHFSYEQPGGVETGKKPPDIHPAEKELIRLVLSAPEIHAHIFSKLNFSWIMHPACKQIAEAVFRLHCDSQFHPDTLKSLFRDSPELVMLIEWGERFHYGENLDQAVFDTLKGLENLSYQNELRELNASLKVKESRHENVTELLQQIDRCHKKIKSVTFAINGKELK
ncbi:MAG: DNA primase [Candidatus Aureabacteria bacterium]|nr:DNA primase [Candidatus Auribacterota bacterium]